MIHYLETMSVAAIATMASFGVGAQAFDAQGHRGARGLLPENSLPGFARAMEIGVHTLELDVGVTAAGQLVVSHDQRLSPAITRDATGTWLAKPTPTINSLTLAALRTYDIGRIDPNSRYAKRFPEQTGLDGVRIPTLRQVIKLADGASGKTIRYNIETKVRPDRPDETLAPDAFADRLVDFIKKAGIIDRVDIQSFDWRTLRRVQEIAPGLPTVYLSDQPWLDNIRSSRSGGSLWTAGLDIDDAGGSVPRLVKAAGGAVWSPDHLELDGEQLKLAHSLGLKVIVWTVNDEARMSALIELGVDGIITDYPDRLREVMKARGLPLPPASPTGQTR